MPDILAFSYEPVWKTYTENLSVKGDLSPSQGGDKEVTHVVLSCVEGMADVGEGS